MKSLRALLLAISLLLANDTIDVSLTNTTGELEFSFNTSEIVFSNGCKLNFSKYDQTLYTNGGSGEFVFSFVDSVSTVKYKNSEVDTTLFFENNSSDNVDTLGIYPTHPVAYYDHWAPKPYEMSTGYEKVFYVSVEGENSVRCEILDNCQTPNFGNLSWETDSLGNEIFKSEEVSVLNTPFVKHPSFTVLNNEIIFNNSAPYSVEIYSATGRLLQEISGFETTVSLSSLGLANGVYQMRIVQETDVFTEQFILR